MLLWLILAIMTAAVAASLIRVLMVREGAGAGGASAEAANAAIYKDQLAEIDADIARGLISENEAQSARVEVSRRLLAAAGEDAGGDDTGQNDVGAGQQALPAGLLYGLCGGLAGIALVFYLSLGTPWLESQPHAVRVAEQSAKSAKLTALIEKVEKRLREHPEDGRGWAVIAPVYMRQGRFEEAARAYQKALKLFGETPARLAGYGQALVMKNNGIVSEQAAKVYAKVLALEPKAAEAKFWLAVAKEQDGKLKEAAEDYQGLLNSAPKQAPWRGLVSQRLQAVRSKIGDGSDGEQAGPTADDISSARKMSPEGRMAMIEQMVAGLAARLEENGNDLEGWKKLLRSYVVLGARDKATKALGEARKELAGDKAKVDAINAFARELGLT